MVFTSAEIGEILAGKLNEKRFHIEDPPVWGDGDIVALLRKNESDRRPRKTSVYVKITGWDVVTTPEGEEYALWFQPSPAPHESRLMVPAGRPRGSEKGYTQNPSLAMRDEPEALSEIEQSVRSQEGRGNFYYHRIRLCREAKERRKNLPIEQRIEEAIAAAKKNGVDVRSNVRTVRRLISRDAPLSIILQNQLVLERRAFREPE